MQIITYIIDLEGVSDSALVSEYFLAKIYGSSCFIRNIQILQRSFPEVSVLVVGAEHHLADLPERIISLSQRYNFSIAFGEPTEPHPPHHLSHRPLVFYQAGLALLQGLKVSDGNDNEVLHVADGDFSLLHLIKAAERVATDKGRQAILCHAFTSSESRGGAVTVYRGQETLDIASMGPELTKKVKRHLEVRASQRSMDGPVSRMIVRHLCHVVSKPLASKGIHPNCVTLAGAFFAFLAVLLFCRGEHVYLAVGGIFWLVGGILDEADGEVARLQGKESTFGSWLDLTLDRILDAAMLLSLAWPLISSYHGKEYLIVTLCALVTVSASSYTGLLYDSWMRSKERHTYFRLGRDVRILIVTVSALLGLRVLPIMLCGAFAGLEICRRFWVCWSTERSISRRVPLKGGLRSSA